MLHSRKVMVDKEKMLQEAVEAGQSGNLAHARELLLELLRLDNKQALYWLLMSTCVDTKEEREYCLHNVLKLDPDNSAARHDLALLGASLPDDEEEDIPDLGEDWQTKEIAAPKIVRKKRPPKEDPWPLGNILGAIGAGLILIFLTYYSINNGLINLGGSETEESTIPAILNATDTNPAEMAEASETPEPTDTSEVVVVSRDPADLLDVPYTPTPLVVNTPHPNSTAFEDAMNAFRAGNYSEAVSLFGQHMASEPDSTDAEYYTGLSYLALEEYDSAWQAFSRSIAIEQQFAPAYVGRAVAAQALEREDSAVITDLNSAILLDSSFAEGYVERARYYLAQGDTARALQDLEQAQNLTPQSVEAQALKAETHLAQEDYGAARLAGERTLDMDITRLDNYLVLAEAYLRLGENNAAVALMQTLLNYEPESSEGWQFLGIAYKQMDQDDLAVDALDKAINFEPTLAQASYYRALIHVQRSEPSAALPMLRVAIEQDQGWFEPRATLAEALLLAGDPGSAFFEINLSAGLIENDEQQAAFHYWRGSALEALGQVDTARADWISLLALPQNTVRDEWLNAAREHTIAP